MTRKNETYKQQARVLRALANETRLMLIDRLSKGECQVGELVRLAGVDQSTVSKHLAVLRNVGVVDDDRRGNAVFYRLLTPCVMDFFACSLKVLRSRG
ncbi:MAG: metalloregulator ArsR/SmtB family transcription factor [bacterium]|jgi:ArsR family transcriptional regulator